jgi:hypothetical protein
MQNIDYDSLSEDEQKVYNEVAIIRERNSGMVAEIEQLGGNVDIATARMEHLLMSLVELGVITTGQLVHIQKDWELSLKPQLRGMRDRMRAIRAEAQKEARTNKLILPPGVNGGS